MRRFFLCLFLSFVDDVNPDCGHTGRYHILAIEGLVKA
jgi:hypothetical protein